jgi:D-aminopeptidase
MFVEFVFFRAKPNVSDAEVIKNAHKIQELATQTGTPFKLELLKTEEGEWVEVVRWNSKEEAQRVEQAVLSMPEAQKAMSVMDEASIRMVFMHPVQP